MTGGLSTRSPALPRGQLACIPRTSALGRVADTRGRGRTPRGQLLGRGDRPSAPLDACPVDLKNHRNQALDVHWNS